MIYQAHGSLGQQVTRKEEGKKPKESSLKESLGSLKRYMVCFVEGALADAKKKWWQPLLGIFFAYVLNAVPHVFPIAPHFIPYP